MFYVICFETIENVCLQTTLNMIILLAKPRYMRYNEPLSYYTNCNFNLASLRDTVASGMARAKLHLGGSEHILPNEQKWMKLPNDQYIYKYKYICIYVYIFIYLHINIYIYIIYACISSSKVCAYYKKIISIFIALKN